MKNVFFLVLSAISFISCKSSYTRIGEKNANYIPYYLKVYEADSLNLVENHEESYTILKKLFKSYEPINLEIYEEYYTYVVLKKKLNINISKKELNNLIIKYGYKIERLKDLVQDSSLSKYLDDNYTFLRKEYLSKINFVLRDSILKMKKNDQLYRGSQFENNIEKQKKIDNHNASKLREIFKNYGYPDKDIIGESLLENFNLNNPKINFNLDILSILLHTTKEERESYFLPILKQFFISGEANPIIYAFVYDQALLYSSQNQYFGSYENKIDDKDLKKINEHRQAIGLPSYGYESWRRKKKYPELFKN